MKTCITCGASITGPGYRLVALKMGADGIPVNQYKCAACLILPADPDAEKTPENGPIDTVDAPVMAAVGSEMGGQYVYTQLSF